MSRQEDFKKAADDYVEGEPDGAQKIVGQVGFEFGAEYGYQYAQTHPNWISVEDELPEKENEFEDYSKLVIVTNGKDFWKGMYNYGGEEWLTFDLWRIDDATHWMPIVPPRKEDKE